MKRKMFIVAALAAAMPLSSLPWLSSAAVAQDYCQGCNQPGVSVTCNLPVLRLLLSGRAGRGASQREVTRVRDGWFPFLGHHHTEIKKIRQRPAQPYQTNKPVTEPQWLAWPPTQAVSSPALHSVLADLEDHGSVQNASFRNHRCRMEWAHELTHHVNNLISLYAGDGVSPQGFYFLNDRCVLLRQPRCTLADVARRIERRGDAFSDYFSGWHLAEHYTRPLRLVDEMIAYTHGAIVGSVYNDHDVDGMRWMWEKEYEHAREMSAYNQALLQAIRDRDPAYPDYGQLEALISFNDLRLDTFAKSTGLRS